MPRSRRQPVSTDKRFRKKHPYSDFGPAERWQHSGRSLVVTERAGIVAARATEEHVVDILVTKKFLSEVQRDAALVFKRDFQRAALGVTMTGSYNPNTALMRDCFRGTHERTELQEAAYRRWRNAVKEMGLAFASAVISTTCHDVTPSLEDIPALQHGLDKLVDWYGLPERA
jgi:hypothetical protein